MIFSNSQQFSFFISYATLIFLRWHLDWIAHGVIRSRGSSFIVLLNLRFGIAHLKVSNLLHISRPDEKIIWFVIMTKIEKRKFDAEIGKVLHLMIHSLYTNKDIFLRELISNSSDAFDKLRFESAKNDQLSAGSQTKIVISTDKNLGILKIRDFGIGMNKQDLIENLGTIARSGTQKFLEKLTGDSKKDIDLIGQFGVGFYSSFMVADEVIVKSRKAGEDKVWCWQSNGEGEFSVFEVPDSDFPCGSEISLRLKDGEQEYLDRFII